MESYLTMLLFNLDSKSTTQFFKINGINTLQKYSKLVKLPEGIGRQLKYFVLNHDKLRNM